MEGTRNRCENGAVEDGCESKELEVLMGELQNELKKYYPSLTCDLICESRSANNYYDFNENELDLCVNFITLTAEGDMPTCIDSGASIPVSPEFTDF